MLQLKQYNACIINDKSGHYIGLDDNSIPFISNHFTKAFKWQSGKKAVNALECLPKSIKKKYHFDVELIEYDNSNVNKELLLDSNYWSGLQFITDEVNEDGLKRRLTKINKILTDYRHFIELGSFNVFEAFKCLIIYQNLLKQRRQLKNELSVITESTSLIEVQCQSYSPRVLKELFR